MLYYAIDVTLLKWKNYRKQIRNGEEMTRIKKGVGAEAKWHDYRMAMSGFFVVMESFCVLTVQC